MESRFVIQKRIQNRSLDAQDTGWRTEGARKSGLERVRPLGLAVREAVGPTAKGALCPREAHAPPMGGWCGRWWLARKFPLSPPFKLISFPPHLCWILKNTSRNSAEFSNFCVFLFWSYLSHTNSKSIDSKTKIVGLEESYKPQVFPEVADFAIFLSWSIFSPRSRLFVQLLLFQFHLWSSLDSYYLIDEICWEVC